MRVRVRVCVCVCVCVPLCACVRVRERENTIGVLAEPKLHGLTVFLFWVCLSSPFDRGKECKKAKQDQLKYFYSAKSCPERLFF